MLFTHNAYPENKRGTLFQILKLEISLGKGFFFSKFPWNFWKSFPNLSKVFKTLLEVSLKYTYLLVVLRVSWNSFFKFPRNSLIFPKFLSIFARFFPISISSRYIPKYFYVSWKFFQTFLKILSFFSSKFEWNFFPTCF